MYSIKMRASEQHTHISGAETLCETDDIEQTIQRFFNKGFFHENGDVDFLNLKIEKVTQPIETLSALPIVEGAELQDLILHHGISTAALNQGWAYIQNQTSYRGAVILSAQTGERLDETGARGVSATRFTFDTQEVCDVNERVQDALAIATCLTHHPQVKGELCVSDDLSYTTGYFATSEGYYRLHHMKPPQSRDGGRVIFVEEDIDLEDYIHFLEETPKRIVYQP